jgi:HEPN domain-containing protein
MKDCVFMESKDIAIEWFKIAENDILSAEYLQNMSPIPVEIICYHCQQSVEKYLKGYLALKGVEIIKTHDLILLNKMCQKHDAEFKKIEEACLILTDYGINVRYPFPLDINDSDMHIALIRAREIKEYVLAKAKVKK